MHSAPYTLVPLPHVWWPGSSSWSAPPQLGGEELEEFAKMFPAIDRTVIQVPGQPALSWKQTLATFHHITIRSYRVSHDTGHLENLAKSQALYKHELVT